MAERNPLVEAWIRSGTSAEQRCGRSAPLGVVMVPVPFSRLAPPRGAQWLGGWLEGLEFGLDFGFGEAHFL
jgi:hypothetical protein